ncbi:hypothetical protein LAV76_15555 [Bacillus paramobilis]|uniref:hypothetical protein n=1 Tax=Bacillus paramobilis TaxID=2817477 RepID=UPI0030C970F7
MKDLRNLEKEELINLLVENFFYEKADLKNKMNIELKETIIAERKFAQNEERQNNGISVIDDNRIVLVASGIDGKVSYESDLTSKSFIWDSHGDLQVMEFKELAYIKRKYPRYLVDGWIIIMDQDVKEQLGQAENIGIEPRELERLFSLNTNEMLERINEYKGSAMEVIYCTARQKLKNGQITDLNKIRSLCTRFGWEIEDFIS